MTQVKTTPNVLELEFPADARYVGEVRERMEQFVRPLGLSAAELDDLKMALSEACGNAICHGSPMGTSNRVRVRAEVSGDRLRVEVSDEGSGFQPEEISLPEEEEWKPSGRGLFLMVSLMDEVSFDATATGTRVRFQKYLQPNGAGQRVPAGCR